MADLLLYNYFRSSTSYRARIALHLKEIPFKYVPVHLLNNGGEQHSADYKKLNPQGEVPSLVHQGRVLAQSMAIIEYLDEVFPQLPLFPKDPWHKAKVRQLCESINCGIHPLQNLKVTQFLEKEMQSSGDQRQSWLHHWIRKGLDAVEVMVGDTFAYGSQVTAADLFIVPQLFSARRMKVPLEKYPKLLAIEKTCLAMEAFKKAHPHFQVDTPEDLRGQLS